MLFLKGQEYTAVDSGVHFHNDEFSEPRGRRRAVVSVAVPWVIAAILACSNIWLFQSRYYSTHRNTFASGWDTDFASVREKIEVEQVVFYGGPSFHDNKTMYIPNPDPVKYVGPPSDEIDRNWDQLTWGRYIIISEAEAHASWGSDVDMYWDPQREGYVAGLDMFHTLHCLGNLRKALHPEYYGATSTDSNSQLHQDHCIEQLRQYIMCSGDMTPIPTKYYSALGRNYVDSDRPHTCRNFEKLRKWMVDRYDESPIIV